MHSDATKLQSVMRSCTGKSYIGVRGKRAAQLTKFRHTVRANAVACAVTDASRHRHRHSTLEPVLQPAAIPPVSNVGVTVKRVNTRDAVHGQRARMTAVPQGHPQEASSDIFA